MELTQIQIQKLQELSTKLHWIKIGEDNIPELYLDNHMLQTFRMCQSRFWEDFVNGRRSKGGRVWFLDFGSLFHDRIEQYYIQRSDKDFDVFKWATDESAEAWDSRDMEYFRDKHKGFDDISGKLGFLALLMQYASVFGLENERFKTVGAELYFGKGKEVPILLDSTFLGFRIYLCGKIDLLMDDGVSIGPMDHKTKGHFRGISPAVDFEIQDGMTGYVYAAQKLIQSPMNELEFCGRKANKIWMNVIQVKPEKDYTKRFARVPLWKTDYQLEQYRLRQISTVKQIVDVLTLGLVPTMNTMACTNYMHQTCFYQNAHRQNSKESYFTIINSEFDTDPTKIWDPEKALVME
jgi:hypothetical protein